MKWTGRLCNSISLVFAVLLPSTVVYIITTESKLTCKFENNNDHYSPTNSHQAQLQAMELLYSFDELTELSHGVVLNIEKIWKEELSQVTLQGNNRHVTYQTIETGGVPERILLITTWRSGSSYVGTLLKSRPGTYYFFEPLHNTFRNMAREESEVQSALKILRDVFHCRNPDGRHTTENLNIGSFFSRSADLLAIATKNHLEFDPTFTNLMCRKSPILAMKVVGLRLRHALPLLEDEKLNLKVIYLVRNPQATMNSRLKQSYWCNELSSCSDFDILCSDLVDNFDVTKTLERDYPQRFMVLRYEDIITRSRTSNQLLKFLHMPVDASTALKTAMNASQLTKWRKELGGNSQLLIQIRSSCTHALDLWGYTT